MIIPATLGFANSLSLIFVIGSQNAFVLRQGLMHAHVFWVCLICAISDAALISIGILGAGSAVLSKPLMTAILTWGGAIFLICYGVRSLCHAFGRATLRAAEDGTGSMRQAILTCLALTWLNPHVYLDTVVLIGAISSSFPVPHEKLAFGFGAILASFVFFFLLGFGARRAARVLARPRNWFILDVLVAIVMFATAARLVSLPLNGGPT